MADRYANGSTALSLQVSISEAMVAQLSAPASCPAKRAFFRFNAIGRMVLSTVLLSISTRPSVRKVQSLPPPNHYLSFELPPPHVEINTPIRASESQAKLQNFGTCVGIISAVYKFFDVIHQRLNGIIVVCPVANLFVQDGVYAFSFRGKVDRIPARRVGEVQRSEKLDKLWPLLIVELIVPKATDSVNVFFRKVVD